MKWVIRAAARQDLHRAALGYSLEDAALGARFRAAVEAEFAKIAAQPNLLGHQIDFRRHAGVRSRVVPGFSHLTFYAVKAGRVEFKRVLHGAQNLSKFFRR